jgi:hypothetical protein
MNEVASILGIDLPVFKARQLMMKPLPRPFPRATLPSMLRHQDSLRLLEKRVKHDDDTVSTASASDCDSDSFLLNETHSVSFAEPLVTKVMTRPYTTMRDKYALYYSNHDYCEFRREAYGYEPRQKLVKFADSMVSEVWTIPAVVDTSLMYYSKKELQR